MPDPAERAPWALQLAARIERREPPTTAAVCAATAQATIALLDDERSRPGGEWHAPVAAWNGARIRKIVRRGRGSAWERAQGPAGVTVCHDGAEVRAYVPCRTDEVPPEISKLQIQSTPLDEVAPVVALPRTEPGTMLIAVTPLFEMSWGKQAAQCAHAGQRAWMLADLETVAQWTGGGRRIGVVHPDPELWRSLVDTADVRIHDGGYTEIPAGTNTTVAWWHRDST